MYSGFILGIFGCQLDEPYGFLGDNQQNVAMFQCHVHSFCIYKVFSVPVSLLYYIGNKTYYDYYRLNQQEML